MGVRLRIKDKALGRLKARHDPGEQKQTHIKQEISDLQEQMERLEGKQEELQEKITIVTQQRKDIALEVVEADGGFQILKYHHKAPGQQDQRVWSKAGQRYYP